MSATTIIDDSLRRHTGLQWDTRLRIAKGIVFELKRNHLIGHCSDDSCPGVIATAVNERERLREACRRALLILVEGVGITDDVIASLKSAINTPKE